jgi:DNA-binding transcriptional ArsR family regulator
VQLFKYVEQQLAQLFSTLSDESRIRIILLLWNRPRTVSELAEGAGMQISAVSHQLSKLRAHDIVACSRIGKQRIYELKIAPLMCVLYRMATCSEGDTCACGVRYAECAKLKEAFHD